MKITLVCVALIAGIYEVTSLNCLTANDHQPPNPNARVGLYTGQQEFSLALLQAINHLNPEGNLFFSPYSTYHALLLAYFMSSNQTEGFLRKALRLDASQNKMDIFNAYKLDKFATQHRAINSSYEFTNANRMYVDGEINVRQCIPEMFVDEYQKADFKSNPEMARNDINKWVETQTHYMITDLLPPGSIDQTTNLVLVNAAYFKGIWENKFDPALTKPEVFYINPSKQTFVDMMHVEGAFNHDISEILMAHILELPYEGDDISMFILLPPFVKDDGVATILKRLTLENFRSIVDEQSSLLARTVQVSVPKFSLEHTIEMVPILESLGVGTLFGTGADFSVLTGARVAIGAGIHKAKIAVDEKGSTAAAASAIFTFRMMNEDPKPILEKLGVGNLFTSSGDFSTLSSANLTLGNALHKAKIEVNEQGTKAAAATVLFTFRSSRPVEPAVFNCNHPFVYVIFDKVEKAILFTGVFRRPY